MIMLARSQASQHQIITPEGFQWRLVDINKEHFKTRNAQSLKLLILLAEKKLTGERETSKMQVLLVQIITWNTARDGHG